ncbi:MULTISPECIES: DUF4270 family protein [unclassified Carboxylicivirga]|uniref:DUF4270 family protein n=1 Tax=Carboxylicivirga TaxID=1628153 RepID=UPI003D32F49E
MRKSLFNKGFLPFFVLLIGNQACQRGALDLGDDFINFPTYTALIDTVTVQLSTIRADSIATSGTEKALIGYYKHPLLGGQAAQSYFAISYPTDFSWNQDHQIFDSLVVMLEPDSYWVGDTCTDAQFQVHRLLEEIAVNEDGNLYNYSSFEYDTTPLAQQCFQPYPQKQEPLAMRLNDGFAYELIEFLTKYENHVDRTSLFSEVFKGLTIKCDTNITRSVLSFNVSDSSCYMRLYSHITGLEQENVSYDFLLSDQQSQFNQLRTISPSGTFQQIKNSKSILKAQESEHRALLQAGIGYKIRIDFPCLNNLLELKSKGYIVNAELRLKPDMQLMQAADLPPHVYAGEIYRANEIWGYLSDTNGNILSSSLVMDPMYHEDTYYAFNLSTYLSNRLNEAVVDTDLGLVITLPDDNMGCSFNWLAINGQSSPLHQSKLLLYYYYYDTE